MANFYPRPVLPCRYCRCLCLSICQSVRRSTTKFVRMITHHPFKLVSPNLVKIPIVLGGDWPWPSRSNLTSKSKFTPFWASEFVHMISHHWLKAGFPNLDQKCISALLRSLLILELIDLDLQFYILFQTCYFLPNFAALNHLLRFIYI